MEGMSKLTIMVGKEVLKAGTAGLVVTLGKEQFIPGGGYLVVADDKAGSAITDPGGAKDAPPVTRPPAGAEIQPVWNSIAEPGIVPYQRRV